LELRSTDVKNENEGLFILLVGEHGSGKTYSIRTCPRPLVLDFDRGMLTNEDAKPSISYLTKEDIKSTDNLRRILDNPPNLPDGSPPSGIIIDSVTAWIDEVLFDEIKGGKGSRVGLTQQDWGRVFVEIQQLFLQCKTLVKDKGKYQYIMLICHTEAKEDKSTGELVMGPSIPGGMFWKAGRHFDIYVRVRSHNTKHSIVHMQGGPFRDRARVVEDKEQPNVGKWLTQFATVRS